jgi:ATP-dependent DNA helicase RecG
LELNDDGSISGISSGDVQRINQLLSNVASQNIRPSINPLTELLTLDQGMILVIDVPKGINKPYQDKKWCNLG